MRRGTKAPQDGPEELAPRERKVPATPGPGGTAGGEEGGGCE